MHTVNAARVKDPAALQRYRFDAWFAGRQGFGFSAHSLRGSYALNQQEDFLRVQVDIAVQDFSIPVRRCFVFAEASL